MNLQRDVRRLLPDIQTPYAQQHSPPAGIGEITTFYFTSVKGIYIGSFSGPDLVNKGNRR